MKKTENFQKWMLADCAVSLSAHPVNIHLLKVLIFLHNFTESASAKNRCQQ
jgi:hypothetical protein